MGSTTKCSFIVSLGSAGLISSTNELWLSKKLNSAYGASLNLSLANRTLAVRRGGGIWFGRRRRCKRGGNSFWQLQ